MYGGSVVLKNFFVPTDESELSDPAVGAAASLFAEVGARVIFVHAIPDIEYGIANPE
jgi:nucleotide-binding universal stress UspA family protein